MEHAGSPKPKRFLFIECNDTVAVVQRVDMQSRRRKRAAKGDSGLQQMVQMINERSRSRSRVECDHAARPCFAQRSPFASAEDIVDEWVEVLAAARWVGLDLPRGDNLTSAAA